MACVCAVSYTHLDVYKRQAFHSSGGLRRGRRYAETDVYKRQLEDGMVR